MSSSAIVIGDEFAIELSALSSSAGAVVRSFLSHYSNSPTIPQRTFHLVTADRRPEIAGERIVDTGHVSAVRSGSVWQLLGSGFAVSSSADTTEIWLRSDRDRDLHAFAALGLPSLLLELGWRAGYIGVHAAAVTLNGAGVLLPGPSGCGKSTILREAARRGLGVLSDDLVWVRRDGNNHSLYPFPRGLPYAAPPAPTVRVATLGALVFPRIVRGARHSAAEPMSAAQALMGLVPEVSMLAGPAGAAPRFRDLGRLAAAVPAFALAAGSDRDGAIQVIEAVAGTLVVGRSCGAPGDHSAAIFPQTFESARPSTARKAPSRGER